MDNPNLIVLNTISDERQIELKNTISGDEIIDCLLKIRTMKYEIEDNIVKFHKLCEYTKIYIDRDTTGYDPWADRYKDRYTKISDTLRPDTIKDIKNQIIDYSSSKFQLCWKHHKFDCKQDNKSI